MTIIKILLLLLIFIIIVIIIILLPNSVTFQNKVQRHFSISWVMESISAVKYTDSN